MVQKQISSAPEREREKTTWPRTHRLEKLMNNWTIVYERTEPSALGSSRQLLASWMNLKHRHRMRFIYQICSKSSLNKDWCLLKTTTRLRPEPSVGPVYTGESTGGRWFTFAGCPNIEPYFKSANDSREAACADAIRTLGSVTEWNIDLTWLLLTLQWGGNPAIVLMPKFALRRF